MQPLESELNHFILITIRCKIYFSLLALHRMFSSNSLFRESIRFEKLFLSKDDVLTLDCEINHFIKITMRCRNLFHAISTYTGWFFLTACFVNPTGSKHYF